jgi:hypothetical protein
VKIEFDAVKDLVRLHLDTLVAVDRAVAVLPGMERVMGIENTARVRLLSANQIVASDVDCRV